MLLCDLSAFSEAEALFRETLAGYRRALGDRHLSTLAACNNLAALLKARGRLDEAEVLFREALAGKRAALGDRHPSTLATVSQLASVLEAHARSRVSGGVAEARLPQEAAVGMYEDVDSEKEEGPRGEEARRRSSSGALPHTHDVAAPVGVASAHHASAVGCCQWV